MGKRTRTWGIVAAVAVGLASLGLTADPAEAAPPLGLPPLSVPLLGNPTPGTDLVASTVSLLTGGTHSECAVSGRGIVVHCQSNVTTLPSASPTAVGVTLGHWVFCKVECTGSLLVHELVHVAQFEAGGDLFGPLYLLEAGVHGTGCENKYEKPAYQTGGTCL